MGEIKNAPGRVIVSVDLEGKNYHEFSNGTRISIMRGYDNFNRRYTEPVNATVVASDFLSSGTDLLISHNATQEMYRIYNYTSLSGKEIASGIRYYAIPEENCFAYLDGEEWLPCRGYEFGLRVYEPYKGTLIGLPPKFIKNVLYVTTGKLKGKVVHTVVASDYEIIYQGLKGQEERKIRFRHWDDTENTREEVTCINHEMTERVLIGDLIVGIAPNNITKVI